MSDKRCSGKGVESNAGKGYEEVRIEKSKNVCNVCEDDYEEICSWPK